MNSLIRPPNLAEHVPEGTTTLINLESPGSHKLNLDVVRVAWLQVMGLARVTARYAGGYEEVYGRGAHLWTDPARMPVEVVYESMETLADWPMTSSRALVHGDAAILVLLGIEAIRPGERNG